MKKISLLKICIQIILISSIAFVSCDEKKNSEADLEIKDGLLYKKGSDTPYTGRERAKVENNILEYDVKDGIKHGEFLIYSTEEVLLIKGQLDSNRNVGKWQYFYPTGELEYEGHFVDNQPEGQWFWYYRDGKKREEGNYNAGMRVGVWYQYDHDGEIVFEKDFDDTSDVSQSNIK